MAEETDESAYGAMSDGSVVMDGMMEVGTDHAPGGKCEDTADLEAEVCGRRFCYCDDLCRVALGLDAAPVTRNVHEKVLCAILVSRFLCEKRNQKMERHTSQAKR